ncbi:DUF5325 family protein [Abyssicoccus albus]|uniref:DUF5325 family protein n=1 Tax=Abyssicoccus albus TaxID=1817405 RepID=UPI000F4E135D|nr:DUF5325 family protein [Abyssicoccus albus]
MTRAQKFLMFCLALTAILILLFICIAVVEGWLISTFIAILLFIAIFGVGFTLKSKWKIE